MANGLFGSVPVVGARASDPDAIKGCCGATAGGAVGW